MEAAVKPGTANAMYCGGVVSGPLSRTSLEVVLEVVEEGLKEWGES